MLLRRREVGWGAQEMSNQSVREGRLRSILRKRKGLKGRSRGADHQRWPNTYFHERGLFSLITAFDSSFQSSRGNITNWTERPYP